jgi:hypothetical protein
MSRDFTITNISSSNLQYVKTVDQIPVLLSIPGPITLRGKHQPYDCEIGSIEKK